MIPTDIHKLSVKKDSKNLPDAFGFTEDELSSYCKRVLKPIIDNNNKDAHISDAIEQIYNNDREPFGLRILGVYIFGRLIEGKANGTLRRVSDGKQLGMPKELKKMLKSLLEDLDIED